MFFRENRPNLNQKISKEEAVFLSIVLFVEAVMIGVVTATVLIVLKVLFDVIEVLRFN